MNPLTRSRLLAVVVTVAAAVWAAPAAGATAAPVSTSAMPAAVDQATLDTSTAIPRWLHQLPPQQYTTFDGQHSLTLTPWQGQHVAVLVPDPRSGEVMAKIVGALDRAWSYYRATTGRVPSANRAINGRLPIAVVPDGDTCGAGCGWLGSTGIEIAQPYFDILYNQVSNQGLYDQVLFYELGRNFWFYTDQLTAPDNTAYRDAVTTGFAVLMRFQSMAAAHAPGAPFNGTPFNAFRSQVAGLIDVYESDPTKTFAGTLGADLSPGAYGGSDFFASIMMRLAARHGGQAFLSRFWRHSVPGRGTATSTTAAVTNLVTSASAAACVDLSRVFYQRWGFPRPDGTTTPRPAANTVPEPTGHC